jgi:hypothetical protein
MQIMTLSCYGFTSLLWQIHFLKEEGWAVASMLKQEDEDNFPSAMLVKYD